MRKFRYILDPICLACIVAYPLNRWVLKPHHVLGDFGRFWFNDLICLPLFLPMILGLQRLLRIRRHDGPPQLWEVLQHAVIFSVLFEVILPRYPQVFRTTADPWDAVCYFVGGLGAWVVWNGRKAHRFAVGPTAKPWALGACGDFERTT